MHETLSSVVGYKAMQTKNQLSSLSGSGINEIQIAYWISVQLKVCIYRKSKVNYSREIGLKDYTILSSMSISLKFMT